MSNRGLRKGKATRTLAKGANPLNTSGLDGDIRIVETSAGPKLKVKSKGKWWTADLKDDTQTQTAGFIPKVWYTKGTTRSSAGDQKIVLPAYVTKNTIVGINFSISIGASERVYFALGGTAALATDSAGDTVLTPSISSGPTAYIYNMYVFYNQKNNYIRFEIQTNANSVMSKDFTLAVLYEDRKGV